MLDRKMWVVVLTICILASASAVSAEKKKGGAKFIGYAAENVYITSDRWPDYSSLQNFYRDACRLENAKTEQEKAIALWRWLRKVMMPGRAPRENIVGVERTLALLNVFGFTDADGLCDLATKIWRVAEGKPAYKVYLPKYDHTTAHLWYEDEDGKWRWHWFDFANGTYLYTRIPTRIATADDLIDDPSLHMIPSKTPVPLSDRQDTRGWFRQPNESVEKLYAARWPGITLTLGQALGFGFVSKDTDDDRFVDCGTKIENDLHWKYKLREYVGNEPGCSEGYLNLDVDGGNALVYSLARFPKNLEPALIGDKSVLALVKGGRGKKGIAVWDFNTGRGIFGGLMTVRFECQGYNGGEATLSLSVDNGITWAKLKKYKINKIEKSQGILIPLGRTVPKDAEHLKVWKNLDKKSAKVARSVFGHHSFMLRCEIEAPTPKDLAIKQIGVTPTLQHNKFVLPNLQAGINRITVKGGMISPDAALMIVYKWYDEEVNFGQDPKWHAVIVEKLPFEYTIVTSAADARNVVPVSILCKGLLATGEGNRVIYNPPSKLKAPTWEYPPSDKLIGVQPAPEMKTEEEYVKDLSSFLDVWKRLHAARILAGIATEQSYEALLLYCNDTRFPLTFDAERRKFGTVSSWVVAALARIEDKRACEVLRPLLNELMVAETSYWNRWAMILALGKLGDKEVVESLMNMYWSSSVPTKRIILQTLAMLQDERGLKLMQDGIKLQQKLVDPDIAGVAALALLSMPKEESLSLLFDVAQWTKNDILRMCVAKLVGTFKVRDYKYVRQLRRYVESDTHEEVRGWAAWALGELGSNTDIFLMRRLLEKEKSDWARGMMEVGMHEIQGKMEEKDSFFMGGE